MGGIATEVVRSAAGQPTYLDHMSAAKDAETLIETVQMYRYPARACR